MTRKLIALDLLLLVALVALAWQLRSEWTGENAREQAFREKIIHPGPAQPLAALSKPGPVTGATYASVAEKNLFSKDRNPNVIIEPEAPPKEKPVPPLPVARGVMLWEGAPATIVLSEKAGGAQKGYHPGEKIGEWTVVSIDHQYVVLEWEGKQFKKRIDELLDRTPILLAEAPGQQNAKPAEPAAKPLSGNQQSGPGIDVGPGLKGCVAGDKSVPGTVVDGMKKVVTETPFGQACRWEQVK